MKLARVNRFTGTMLAIALVAGCVGVFLFLDLYRSQQDSRRNYAGAVRGLDLIGELQYQAQEARRTLLYALSTTDSNLQVDYADQSRAAEAQVAQRLAEYEQLALVKKDTASAAKVARDWATYLAVRDELIAAMLEGDPKAAIARDLRDGVPAFNALRDDLEKTRDLLKRGADQLLREVDDSFQRSLLRMGGILGMLAVLGFVGAKMAQDRTLLGELRETETRLREDFARARREERATAELFAAVLRAATEYSIIGTTSDGLITVFNEGAERMLGYRADEAIGTLNPTVIHDPGEVAARAAELGIAPGFEVFAAAARRGEAETREWTYLRKDGSRFPVSLTVSAMRDGAGTLAGFIGIATDISERAAAAEELRLSQQKLLETSRLAGMAEVATGVLHNVGNVLNSVNVSANLALEKLRRSKVTKLGKAAELLVSRNGSLAEYLTQDENGRKLPGYLARLGQHLVEENLQLVGEVDQLSRNIEHIKEIVAMQQSFAKVSGVFEMLPVEQLVEDAIAMNYGAFERHRVVVERRFSPAPRARVDRHQVLQILINLLRNAKYALDEVDRPDKKITISIEPAADHVRIAITDNGVGIAPENLDRIFGHGFTTKRDGHGFGLHSGGNAAAEMNGRLTATSAGLGHGATFTLELPCATAAPEPAANA